MALEGVVLFISNDSSAVPVVDLAASLGATVTHSTTEAVNAIIADKVTESWYLTITQTNPKAPVLKPAWLEACSTPAGRVAFEKYELLPLEGCEISLTGFTDADERADLANHLKAAGGKFSAELKRAFTTHLITASTLNSKYKYAQAWGICTVSPAWLAACIKHGRRLDESRFPVQSGHPAPDPALPAPTNAPSEVAATTSHRSISLAQGIAPAPSRAASDAPAPSATTTRGPTAPAEASLPPLPPPQDQIYGDWTFLDWVRYVPVGLTEQELLWVRQLAARGAAVREPALARHITHILVGSQPTPSELSSIKEHWMAWKEHVRVVRLQWLHECVVKGECVEPVEPHLRYPLTTVPTRALSLPEPSAASLPAVGAAPAIPGLAAWTGAGTASVDFCDLAGLDTRSRAGLDASAQQGPPVQERNLSRDKAQALDGFWFTLAAMPGDKELLKLVRSHGGQVFTADNLRKVKGMGQAFALCPHGMHPQTVQDLERTAPDYRSVPHTQRVTGYWLEMCLMLSRLMDPAQLPLLYKPLPFDLPLPAFSGEARIHVAGYNALSVKKQVIKQLEVLGAIVTNNLSHVNTHLVLPELPQPAPGPSQNPTKYDIAVRYGIIAVNEAWVTQTAKTGRIPDPWQSIYRPHRETPQQLDKMRKAVSARQQGTLTFPAASIAGRSASVAATQLGATQLPTQQPVADSAASKSVCYNSATGFKLTSDSVGGGVGGGGKRGLGEEDVAVQRSVGARATHPSGIPTGPSAGITTQQADRTRTVDPTTHQPAPTAAARVQPTEPSGHDRAPVDNLAPNPKKPKLVSAASLVTSSAAGDAAVTIVPAASKAGGKVAKSGAVEAVASVAGSRGLAAAQNQGQTGGVSEGMRVVQLDELSRDDASSSAFANVTRGTGGAKERHAAQQPDQQQQQQPAAAQPQQRIAAETQGQGEEDILTLQTSIQTLLQHHGKGDAPMDPCGSQADPVLLAVGMLAGARPAASGMEPSRSSGGASGLAGSVGGQGGDIISSLASGPERRSRRTPARPPVDSSTLSKHGGRLTRSSMASRQASMDIQMSQQVEYDAGASQDRLLRSQSGTGGRQASGGGGQPDKQAFISRVLRTRTPSNAE